MTKQDCIALSDYIEIYHSQCGEAGIINRIFELIGVTNKVAVEFGGLDGYSLSNTRHLAKQDWRIVMFDGTHSDPLVIQALVTAENVNDLFEEQAIPLEFDLLSIDVDGNDYWIWKALHYTPRVIVIEFNGTIQPGQRKTIPYNPYFVHDGTDYYGASFDLLCDLGHAKGYTPIFQLHSLNLFLLRSDLLVGPVPEVTYMSSQGHPPDQLHRPWVTPDPPAPQLTVS